MIAYHVTLRKNVRNILDKGLQPRVGPRSKELGDLNPGISMYSSRDDCISGMSGWFGDCFIGNSISDLVIFELNISSRILCGYPVMGEINVLEKVESGSIIGIWNYKFEVEISHEFN